MSLRAIDGNTALANFQSLAFVSTENVANNRTIVRDGKNGDGVADLQIELLGQHSLSSSDFML
jgi:hypothetical protein